MTRYLLDTTIISEATKPFPSESLSAWLAHQSDDDLHISSLTIAEIRRGILEKPKGRLAGKPSSDLDLIMAAVAEVNDCSLVTDNEKHFPGIPVLTPLRRPR